MSHGWQLELTRADNGDVFVDFWDHLHGEDKHWIVLASDSQIYHAKEAEAVEPPIYDFGAEIERLIEWLEARK